MRPKRIKVHPIGWQKPFVRHTAENKGETIDYVQTIRMSNGQIRVIPHYKVYALGGLW